MNFWDTCCMWMQCCYETGTAKSWQCWQKKNVKCIVSMKCQWHYAEDLWSILGAVYHVTTLHYNVRCLKINLYHLLTLNQNFQWLTIVDLMLLVFLIYFHFFHEIIAGGYKTSSASISLDHLQFVKMLLAIKKNTSVKGLWVEKSCICMENSKFFLSIIISLALVYMGHNRLLVSFKYSLCY